MPNSELIKEIFSVALGTKSPAERGVYLDQACQGQPELRNDLDSLLRAHDQAGEFLGKAAPIPVSKFEAERTGAMIGCYRLLEPIGEGGFGSVWMAEQEEPMRRRVALKVIKAGMDTKQVLARFESERQALAMMDHPCIARVFDGGATEAGRPYFVMELVLGAPITDYSDANKLSMGERLRLFVQVCRALQHAHQKGIIHRDLKPSNILVTEVDGAPTPKVIDFGVAKATEARLTDRTLFTGLHQMIGTPAYMSPEQAGLGALDMDTRSDIYALGVLLYELLTSQTPLTKKDCERAALPEIFRLIREQEPLKPSTRLSALTREELTAIAARRRAQPVRLNRLISGDLDWIVMKALEKDRRRRYETAGAFALDVERHLRNEPVAASPPSVGYRLQKLIRRRKVAFASGSGVFLVVLAGTLRWWFLPGTLHLEVTPADTLIEIDDREYQDDPMQQQIRLSAGVHQIRFHKAEFSDEVRTIVVPRGGYVSVPHLTMKHEEGTLDVQSSPAGTGIHFEGVDYYSAIKERPTDTGVHELVGFAEGYFENRRAVTIKRNERLSERLSLESGVSWKYESAGIQNSYFILSNTVPNQPAVIADVETSKIVFLSTADGAALSSINFPDGNNTKVVQLNLGAEIGSALVAGVEKPGIGSTLRAYKCSYPATLLWEWRGPAINDGWPDGLSMVAVSNQTEAGSIAVGGRDGHVRVISGRTGALEQDFILATNHPVLLPLLRSWIQDGRTYLLGLLRLHGTDPSRPNELTYQGVLIDVAARSEVCRNVLGTAEGDCFADLDQSHGPGILLWDAHRWRLFDAFSGKLVSSRSLPGRLLSQDIILADVEGKGRNGFVFQFEDPTLPMMAVRLNDGSTVWQGPTNIALHGGYYGGVTQPTVDGLLLAPVGDSLVAIETASGKIRWELKGEPTGWLVESETKSIYVTLADRRLVCLSASGQTNWTMRLGQDVVPRMLAPARLQGGQPDVLLSHPSAIIETVHWPHFLWDVLATGPLAATPLIVKNSTEDPVVLETGPWSGKTTMLGLAGSSGRALWSNREFVPPNRAPALACFDGNGLIAVGAIAWDVHSNDLRLVIRRADDGTLVREPVVMLSGWMTGGVAADFRGIGRCDMAVSAWDDKSIALIEGRTGNCLWRQPTEKENMGGLTAVDIDGDGLPDVIGTSLDGHVYAFCGKNGKQLWKTVSNQYPSVSQPTVSDLDGDGKLEALITTDQGRLFALKIADGSFIWSPRIVGNLPIAGRPAVASLNGRKLVLAPMGTLGVVAFDWSSRTEVWRSPKGYSCIASPTLADLAHDGRRQVVVGTTDGEVFVLDLADGEPLWQLKVAQNTIEADPVVVDLNRDGVDDILIASHDARLYAINGRNIVTASTSAAAKAPQSIGQAGNPP